ncbi:hypothetical protein MJO29_006383 [Puccinia striiformis f. sp. tritici]|nr:hypothetical protein MJO29_006383 [Puccinia striiformis f. sp. tritici]
MVDAAAYLIVGLLAFGSTTVSSSPTSIGGWFYHDHIIQPQDYYDANHPQEYKEVVGHQFTSDVIGLPCTSEVDINKNNEVWTSNPFPSDCECLVFYGKQSILPEPIHGNPMPLPPLSARRSMYRVGTKRVEPVKYFRGNLPPRNSRQAPQTITIRYRTWSSNLLDGCTQEAEREATKIAEEPSNRLDPLKRKAQGEPDRL